MKKRISLLFICCMFMMTLVGCGGPEEIGFELVSAGKVEYYVNETLDLSGIELNAKYKNGKEEALDVTKVTIDSSAVDMSNAGEYSVKISYKKYEDITFTIYVYEKEVGYELASAGKVEYYVGEALDFSELTLKSICESGAKIPLDTSKVTIDTSLVNMNQAGEYTVTISYKEYEDITFTVNVSKKEIGFELASAGKVEYYVGETLDLSGLRLNKVFEIGEKEPLDVANVTIDSSAVDMSKIGEYTVRISYKEYEDVTFRVKVSKEETGIELVSAGKVEYYVNETLDLSGVELNVIYKTNEREPLDTSKVAIDTSLVDMTNSGEYEVKISYKEFEDVNFTIKVYEYTQMILGVDATEKLSTNTSYGNGIYYNHSFKEIYAIGDTFDNTGLSVIVVKTCGETSQEYRITNYTISGFDSSTAGSKNLTIDYEYTTGRSVTANITVYVVDTAPSIVEGVYQVKVDKTYNDTVGAVVDGYNMFTTIQQALDFLADADEDSYKLIMVGEGIYTEKLEIAIPNLTIIGAGANLTTIEWDSIYGAEDASGYVQTTESTATVAVREEAVNCVIKDITISNYWNSQDRVDVAGINIERASALLIQADKFMMKNGAVLGIQDTLALFTGRQYFENTYISGYMDFIFGTNNTTYFKNCTIHVIETSKSSGAVITAVKGCNRGEVDYITYGVIFDGCNFTADDGVAAGTTALGRPWGSYAAVATLNSSLGGHISVAGYSTGNRERYVDMNANPTDSTVKYVEYNNTGDGAIQQAVSGMEMIAAGTAIYYYANFSVVFGKTNGLVSYVDVWDPTVAAVGGDDKTYYYFTEDSSQTGTSYTYDLTTTAIQGSKVEWLDFELNAEAGKIAWDSNSKCLYITSGAFIKFTVRAGTLVTIETHYNYSNFTLNGVATSSKNILHRYYAEETELTLLSTGSLYLHTIILDPNAEAPHAASIEKIEIEGVTTKYNVGEDFTFDGSTVRVYYSDNAIVTITDYIVDSSLVNKDEEGTYTIIISYGGVSQTVDISYINPNKTYEIVDNTYLDFSSSAGYNEVESNIRVSLDGDFRLNGSEYQVKGTISFPVKSGTTVTVIPYNNPAYVSYTLGMYGETNLETLTETTSKTFSEDCVVVYTGLDNNYLVGIQISCGIGEGKYVFGGSTEEGDYTGILESTANLVVSGITTHSSGAQLGQNSEISFNVPALSTVVIKGHSVEYGQLLVYVNDELIEMDSNGCYTFSTEFSFARVIIKAKNVGTEDAPAYNKSYITYINVNTLEYIDKNTTISFGSNGNYNDIEGLDISNVQISNNGADNSQVKNGYISFAVKSGATITVNGYPNYTSYTFNDGTLTSGEITDQTHTYTAQRDVIVIITPVNNNYFYSIVVSYES